MRTRLAISAVVAAFLAALALGAAAQEAGVPAWFWYDGEAAEPLMLVVDLPLGAILLKVPVLHSQPEGVLADWPAQLPRIAQALATRSMA